MEILLYSLIMLFPTYYAYSVTVATQAAIKYITVRIGVFTNFTYKKAKVTKFFTLIFCSTVSIFGGVSLAHVLFGDNAMPFWILFSIGSCVVNYIIIYVVDWNPSFPKYL